MTAVVYHVETHRDPRQVERLVATINRWAPESLIVINHDERAEPLNEAALRKLGAVVQYGLGGYSDFSHPRRWLQTVDWLTRNRVEYDWLSNLSGQDYPIRPLSRVHDELAASGADAFLETFDVFDPEQTPWGMARGTTRYRFRHRRLGGLSHGQKVMLRPVQVVNRVQPWYRLTSATGLTLGRRVPAPWGDGMRLLGGSFFTTLRRPAVEHVRAFVDEQPEVMAFLAGALAPAEVFFQTALGQQDGADLTIVNDCRRYFDFSRTRFNSPKTLGLADLPSMMASGKDFARKFDLASEPDALDAVDQHLERAVADAVG